MEEWNNKKTLTSFTVGSTVAFDFVGTRIGIFVWNTNGKKNVIKPGRALCWVDEDKAHGTVVDAYTPSEFSSGGFTSIQEGLVDGKQCVCFSSCFCARAHLPTWSVW